MEIKTKRLTIERIRRQNVNKLSPLLKYQSLFQQAGMVTSGIVDIPTLRLLAQTECVLLLREQRQGTVVGLIVLLHSYDETGKTIAKQYEVGYLLLPQAQHQGYMTEALNVVCDRLEQSQIKVIAEVAKCNFHSIGVLKRCEFTLVTTNTSKTIEQWRR